MRALDWMRSLAMLLYCFGIAAVINSCRQATPASMSPPAAAPPSNATDTRLLSRRKQLDAELHKRRAALARLEAELLQLSADFPALLHDLAREAMRFTAKTPELQRLEPRARWEREAPVKQALTRVRAVVSDYHRLDAEAQKERDEPTLYTGAISAALSARIISHPRHADDTPHAFADDVQRLLGKVPEALLLEALDVLARKALPTDSFDPCRDPAQCPKPVVERELKPAAAPATPAPIPVPAPAPTPPVSLPERRELRDIVEYCADPEALRGARLPLREDPTPLSPALGYIRGGECGLRGTGEIVPHRQPAGVFVWIEVVRRDRSIGWVNSYYVRQRR
jgi:hypothetical protein